MTEGSAQLLGVKASPGAAVLPQPGAGTARRAASCSRGWDEPSEKDSLFNCMHFSRGREHAHGGIYGFACSSEHKKRKKYTTLITSCYKLCLQVPFRAAVDFSVLLPGRISFDKAVPENHCPAVSGKPAGTARPRTQRARAWPIHTAR